jgi:hypothetical protein
VQVCFPAGQVAVGPGGGVAEVAFGRGQVLVGVGEQAEDVAAHRAGLAGLDFGPQAVGVPEVAGLDQQAGRAQQPAVGVAAAGAEPRGPQQVAGGDGVVVALGFHAGGQVGLLRQGVVGPVGGRHPVRERRVALQHPAR